MRRQEAGVARGRHWGRSTCRRGPGRRARGVGGGRRRQGRGAHGWPHREGRARPGPTRRTARTPRRRARVRGAGPGRPPARRRTAVGPVPARGRPGRGGAESGPAQALRSHARRGRSRARAPVSLVRARGGRLLGRGAARRPPHPRGLKEGGGPGNVEVGEGRPARSRREGAKMGGHWEVGGGCGRKTRLRTRQGRDA